MSHGPHQSNVSDTILFDGCDTCEGRAESIEWLVGGLDTDHLAALWRRMVAVETGAREGYASTAEARACKKLNAARILITRIPETMIATNTMPSGRIY